MSLLAILEKIILHFQRNISYSQAIFPLITLFFLINLNLKFGTELYSACERWVDGADKLLRIFRNHTVALTSTAGRS